MVLVLVAARIDLPLGRCLRASAVPPVGWFLVLFGLDPLIAPGICNDIAGSCTVLGLAATIGEHPEAVVRALDHGLAEARAISSDFLRACHSSHFRHTHEQVAAFREVCGRMDRLSASAAAVNPAALDETHAHVTAWWG